MSIVSILLADDDRDMVDSLSRWLQRKGYQTRPTYHPMQCLIAAATDHYDVAVIDLGLPDMSGFGLLIELVQRSHFPVIVLSGHDDSEFKAEAIRQGAAQYLVKPASMQQIEKAINDAITQHFAATPNSPTCMRGAGGGYHLDVESLNQSSESIAVTDARVGLLEERQ